MRACAVLLGRTLAEDGGAPMAQAAPRSASLLPGAPTASSSAAGGSTGGKPNHPLPENTAVITSEAYAAQRAKASQGSLFLRAALEVLSCTGIHRPLLQSMGDVGMLLCSDRFIGKDNRKTAVPVVVHTLAPPGDVVLAQLKLRLQTGV